MRHFSLTLEGVSKFLPTHARSWFLVLGISIILGVTVLSFSTWTNARNISTFKDTISNSAPGEYANHTIEFNVNTAIPAGGFVRVRVGDGDFSIPGATFDEDQAQLYVSHASGGYVLRSATTTADADYDGINITYGATSQVEFTLNSTAGISSGDRIKILLGSHTTTSTTTDTGILNASATGTQPVYIEVGGGEEGEARALIAIIDQVNAGPGDTTEHVPPVRTEGAPTGEISGIVSSVEVSLETDEFASCRYSQTSGVDFFSMGNEFTDTGSIFHRLIVTGIVPATTYTFYVRCMDDELNYNIDDYEITFTVKPLPEGDPGTGVDDSTGGTGTGGGTGSSGSGGGSTSGSTGSNSSGSGGSRGGGGGGGGLDSSNNPYESGDATVVVSGYAFPGSKIFVLVDGAIADQGTAGSNGSFSATLDAIARGVYTFGVYAVDKNGTKSSTFSTTFSVAGARTSTLSNIHLMPTIVAAPNPVDPGAVITFSGYAIPNSTVALEVQQDKSGSAVTTLSATSDGSGKWSATQSTQGFAKDKWKVRAKSTQETLAISTNFSQYTFFSVGGAAVPATGNNSDLNRDGKVNLIDFSILLFHWNTNGGTSNPPADINRDGKVSLTDFSIMIFNWTG